MGFLNEYVGRFSILKRSALEKFLKQKEGTPRSALIYLLTPAALVLLPALLLLVSYFLLSFIVQVFPFLFLALQLVMFSLLVPILPIITLAVSAILFVFFLLFVFFTAKLAGSRRPFKAHFYFFSVIWSLFTFIYLLASLLWSFMVIPILGSGFFFILVFSPVLYLLLTAYFTYVIYLFYRLFHGIGRLLAILFAVLPPLLLFSLFLVLIAYIFIGSLGAYPGGPGN